MKIKLRHFLTLLIRLKTNNCFMLSCCVPFLGIYLGYYALWYPSLGSLSDRHYHMGWHLSLGSLPDMHYHTWFWDHFQIGTTIPDFGISARYALPYLILGSLPDMHYHTWLLDHFQIGTTTTPVFVITYLPLNASWFHLYTFSWPQENPL